MAVHPKLKLRYAFENQYLGTAQLNWVGAQADPYKRGWWANAPTLTDAGTPSIRGMVRVGRVMYCVGNFDTVGGVARVNAMAFDMLTQEVQAWAPAVSLGTLNRIDALANADGSYSFFISGTSGVAKYNELGELDAAWLPNPSGGAVTVNGLKVVNAGSIFIYGIFEDCGGQARNCIAQVNSTDGAATAMDASITSGSEQISGIDYDSVADQLYLAGDFSGIGGTARNRIARWNVSANTIDAGWNPNLNGSAIVVKFKSASSIFIGGSFTTVNGGTTRNRLCEVDGSGTVKSFNPNLNNSCRDIAIDADEFIYAVGAFTTVAGGTTRNLSASWEADGTLRSWNPNFAATSLHRILVQDRTIYCFGLLTSYKGVAVTGIKNVQNIIFDDDNSIFISKLTGDDGNAGTQAAPLRSLEGAIGVEPSYLDQSGNGNDPTMQGTVFLHPRGFTDPPYGSFFAGLFSDSNYYNLPAAIGNAIAASGHFTVRMKIYAFRVPANNAEVIWKYKDGALTSLSLNTNLTINFQLRGTTLTSLTAIKVRKWHEVRITYEYDAAGTGLTKRIYLDEVLVGQASQTAVMAGHVDMEIGRNVDTANRAFDGFINDVEIYSGYHIEFPITNKTDREAWYPFQTKSVAEDAGAEYVVFTDSEHYKEPTLLNYIDGLSIMAEDGCKPTLSLAMGAEADTYGARRVGREKFSSGVASTVYHISKSGSDSTGIRGDETLPFLTLQAALDDGSRAANDTFQFDDSGVYQEGDIDLGSDDLTIQAHDGKVPTLHIKSWTSSADVLMYGVILSGATATVVEAWDCTTIYNGAITATSSVKNCYAENGTFTSPTIRNSFFERGIASGFTLLERTSFTGGGILFAADTGYIGTRIKNCEFEKGYGISLDATSGGIPSILRALFVKDVKGTVELTTDDQVGATMSYFALDNIYVDDDLSNDHFTVNQPKGENSNDNGYIALRNCISIGAARDGFVLNKVINAGTITKRIVVRNSAVIGAGRYGVEIPGTTNNNQAGSFDQQTVYLAQSFLESGSTTAAVHTVAQGGSISGLLFDYSIIRGSFLNDGAGPSGLRTASFATDPLFLSVVAGAENSSLSPRSLAIEALTPYRDDEPVLSSLASLGNQPFADLGPWRALLEITGEACRVEGIEFDGDINSPMSIAFISSSFFQTGEVRYCSFVGQGADFLRTQGGTYTNNFMFGGNGGGFRASLVNPTIQRNVGVALGGAFILNSSTSPSISHNSSFGCFAGQYDRLSSGGEFRENILSASGTYDYEGFSEQKYSDIETLSPEAEIDANSTQKRPLYQDPYNGDLRLQALALGYAFDSPAKGLAEDGTAAGAFIYYYGPLTLCYIEIDFNQSGWYNPDDIPETMYAANIAEGDKPVGSVYSSASGYKRQWDVKWNATNPMPHNQRLALQQMYVFQDADIEVTFDDGVTWIPATLMKSQPFIHDEVTLQYTQDDTPRPIASLMIRER